MDVEKRISKLEQIIHEAQEELKELKRPFNLLDLKDGDWIHLQCFDVCYIMSYKQVDGLSGGAYLAHLVEANILSEKFYENENNFFDFNGNHKVRRATLEEVKKTLRAFAKHKGFVDGAKYHALMENFDAIDLSLKSQRVNYMAGYLSTRFSEGKYYLYSADNDGYIYYDGRWAELVVDFEIVPGYPVKYISDELCEINGLKYEKKQIINLANSIDSINGPGETQRVINSLNVGCKGQFQLTSKNLRDLLANWVVREEEFAPKKSLLTRYGLNKFNRHGQ